MEKNVDFIKYDNSKSDEYIRLDTTIIGIDNLIAKASSAEEANALFKAKDVIYSQKRHSTYRQPDNGWISVEDRLPEEDGKYMVWYKGELDICEFDTDSQTFGYTYDDYDEFYSHLVCWDDGMNEDVTHWQPLPNPPKGE